MKKIYSHTKLFIFLLMAVSLSFSANAAIYPFSFTYSGANENPPNASPATGTVSGTYDNVTKKIFYAVTFSGLTTAATGAHFHAPALPGANSPVIIPFANFPVATSGTYSGSTTLTALQETQLFAGLWYANIHSSTYPGGEIRVQVTLGAPSSAIYSFSKTYAGSNENPANASTATGTVMGTYNSTSHRLFYTVDYTGLTGNATGAHFHGPAIPGLNASIVVPFNGFPATPTGNYSGFADLTPTQEADLLGGKWYANIHTAAFPGGEIRTQIFFNEIAAPTSITCTPVTVSNAPGLCSQTVSFSATTAGTPTPALFYRIGNTVITSPRSFPVGTTTVTATALNGGGFLTCTFNVVVNDREAPAINDLSVSPDKLWSPNHKMNDITVNYTTTDNCPGPISCSLSVASNEAANGKGDGNTASDWAVMDNHHVQLRAERSGKGSDRVYTITTSCQDQYGNIRQSARTVTVPHNASSARISDNTNASQLKLGILNNPSRTYFTLNIQATNNTDKIVVRLFDLNGKMLELKSNLQGSQLLKVGSDLKVGFYIVEVSQGSQKTQLKLVKSK